MRKERIIAVNSNCYHGFTIEEAIRGIKAAGFRYIELTATKGWTEHVFPDMSFRRIGDIRELLKDSGLVPFATSGHTNLMDEARLPDFEANIRLAHFFGSRYIISSVGEAHLADAAKAGTPMVARHIRGLLPLLEEYDMQLMLEIHGEHGTGGAIREIVEAVGSPRVGINYDTANAIFYGGVDVPKDMAEVMDSIRYVHLKDKAGAQKEWNFPALGEGDVPFPVIFEQMDKADNLSPYSIEIEFTQKGPSGLEEVNRAVMNSARYLKEQGFTL